LAHPETDGELRVLVSAVRSLIQPIAPGLGDLPPLRLKVGDTYDFDALLHRLVELAYVRVEMVTARGEFAVRGGIVDVFPPTAEHPVRVELWGDEVAELRQFTVADQRSVGPVDVLDAPPCRELLLTAEVRARAAELAKAHENNPQLAELFGKLAEGIPVEGMESLIPPLVGSALQMLTDLMPAGSHVLLLDPERVDARSHDLVRTGTEFLEASWLNAATGGAAPIDLGASAYRSLADAAEHARATGRSWNTLSPLTSSDDDVIRPGFTATQTYRGELDRALADLRAHTATGGTAVIVVAGAGTAQRAFERLGEADVPARLELEGLPTPPEPGLVTVTRGALLDGFIGDQGLVVLTEADLTGSRGEEVLRKLPSRRRNAVELVSLRPGDFVVHSQHGIGRFVEMRRRETNGATREYLVLEYSSTRRGYPPDRLFVPTDSLDEVSRYVGGEVPALNKLGGADWARTKGRARKAVKQIAAQLVQLYAARQSSPGYAFGPDTPWQRELEDAFPYTETPDQLAAIDEVKADMERPVPMDRVISGDVGFGKTEIAVRAAFKAVQDGKQVAVLVPTTLLASQHLQTFADRMRSFPVTVKGLSRFTDTAESRAVLDGMADGSVDIVIGTHRLLQTGVRWKDLGLVVVDEEQRFGVEHKEHIKALRTHVDVLTMSATPIPRTLEMSLAGIREMSTILTPPEERYPVLTYVGPQDGKQVAAALRRELLRDGQAFYIHNRVSSIDQAAARVRALVPEARVAVAHGQMPEEALESTVEGFWNREYDILVCTTIVETGLDISNANTLIVERADTFGLSQLHQLRGRVGRSRERGYAYFLYPPEVPLTETAYDRLATIAQNNELGAGMAVAMKDLEIRGAGNVLGVEQSGHVAGVGFDLYVRLVGEAVEAYRAAADGQTVAAVEEPKDVRIDLPVDAHLPPDYIASDRLRLEGYRRLAAAADEDAIAAVVEELVDRYGPLPEPALRLVAVARLRLLARQYGLTEVSATGTGSATTLRLAPLTLLDSQQLRLKRLYPGSNYRATTSTVQVPIPRAGTGMGAPRIRDLELVQMVMGLVLALDGKPLGDVGITNVGGGTTMSARAKSQAR
ncbi:MAG: transcription-repair coupling factor, partial [Mycobacterium sp.]|nr:transcription-repair coupling factor [Mycobacterium sp.]